MWQTQNRNTVIFHEILPALSDQEKLLPKRMKIIHSRVEKMCKTENGIPKVNGSRIINTLLWVNLYKQIVCKLGDIYCNASKEI